mgnify:FL=1
MKMLYTAVGIFKLKNQGKNNVYPTVILSGKECRLDVQEMMIWSVLNWRITDDRQLHTYYSEQEKMSGVVFSRSYTDTLNRLIVRGLVASGRGENSEDALYNLISNLYIIPLYQSPVIRMISFIRMLFIFKLPYEKAKVLFERDKKNKNERRIMKLAFSAPMSTAEIVKCMDKNIDFILNEDDVMEFLYDDKFTTSENIAESVRGLSSVRTVLTAVSNLYLRRQILFERM